MNYRQAMAAVAAKYRNPRTVSCAAAFLERYSASARPLTAWHAVGEDADATKTLIEALGFAEGTHFTVQTSELDPYAHRFSWTDAGAKLIGRMAEELEAHMAPGGFDKLQRGILKPGEKCDPGLLPDVDSESGRQSEARGDNLMATMLSVVGITAVLILQSQGRYAEPHAVEWAIWVKDYSARGAALPVMVPLYVLEAMARADGVEGVPEFSVFEPHDNAQCTYVRAVNGDERIPSPRLNGMPLEDQPPSCDEALHGYFAENSWQASEFGRSEAIWVQFDARIMNTAEALNFALDAAQMRRFTESVVDHAYGPLKSVLSSTTRLAVDNLFLPDCAHGRPAADTELDYRISNSEMVGALGRRSVMYMGAMVLAEQVVTQEWPDVRTHPVTMLPPGGTNEALTGRWLGKSELADEWFAIVHGIGLAGAAHDTVVYPGDEAEWSDNLERFRHMMKVSRESPENTLKACSTDNPAFYINPDHSEKSTCPALFLGNICAAMRKLEDGRAMEIVRDSPHNPNKIIAAVWSGLRTDLAPTSLAEVEEDGVFPFVGGREFTSYVDDARSKAYVTKLLDLFRRKPQVQFGVGKRSSGRHRSHVIVLETNIRADKFVKAALSDITRAWFQGAVWRSFCTSFLMRKKAPLVALDTRFSCFGTGGLTNALDAAVKTYVPGMAGVFWNEVSPVYDPERLDIRWLEDDRGRLVLVLASQVPSLAQRARLAYRMENAMPLMTATYAVKHGMLEVVETDESMGPQDKYDAVLNAAVRQPAFLAGQRDTNTLDSYGKFGTIWLVDPCSDLDHDELPTRSWYLLDHVSERVGAYLP